MKKYFTVILSVIFVALSSANIALAAQTQIGTLGGTSGTCPEVIVNTSDSTDSQKQVQINELYGSSAAHLSTSTLNNGNPEEALQALNPVSKKIAPLYVDSNGQATFTDTGIKFTRGYLLDQVSKYYGNISCPATITGLQTLFLRMLVLVNTFVGLVLFYVIARAAIIRMTARGDAEAVKKSMSMISNAIVGLVIVIIAYTAVVFIGTQFLPNDPCQKFSFVDSGRILFFFDQSDISPNQVTNAENSNCP